MITQERKNKIAKIVSIVFTIIAVWALISMAIYVWKTDIRTAWLGRSLGTYYIFIFFGSIVILISSLFFMLATERRRWLRGMESAFLGMVVGVLLGWCWLMWAESIKISEWFLGILSCGIAGAIVGLLLFVEILTVRKLVQIKSKMVKISSIFLTVILGITINVFLLYKLAIIMPIWVW